MKIWSGAERVAASLSRWSLAVLLVAATFGFSAPFGARSKEIEVVFRANPVRQVALAALFLCAAYCLAFKMRDLARLALRERLLSLFLLWCTTTILWSAYPFVSFKRLVQILACAGVVSAYLLWGGSREEALRLVRMVLAVFLLLSLASIFLVPGSVDPGFLGEEDYWRGLASHKNGLGMLCLMAILIFGSEFAGRPNWRTGALLAVAVVLLGGSGSVTSIVALLLVSLLGIASLIVGRLWSSRRSLAVTLLVAIVVFPLVVVLFLPEVLDPALAVVGRNSSLTGRVNLWIFTWGEARDHLLQGAGFGGFWVAAHEPRMEYLELTGWYPWSAHQGFLDLLNETGLIGLTLALLILLLSLARAFRDPSTRIWGWLMTAILIINLMESAYLRETELTTLLVMLLHLGYHATAVGGGNPSRADPEVSDGPPAPA